jgi:hypothetical protein
VTGAEFQKVGWRKKELLPTYGENLDPAWPLGGMEWDQRGSRYNGSVGMHPTGITRAGHLVPMQGVALERCRAHRGLVLERLENFVAKHDVPVEPPRLPAKPGLN